MQDCLFTFLMDFQGGTYLSQVNAPFETSCNVWASSVEVSEIAGFGELQRDQLIACMNHESPTALENMDGVWCVTALIDNDLVLVHIVKTTPNDQKLTSLH